VGHSGSIRRKTFMLVLLTSAETDPLVIWRTCNEDVFIGWRGVRSSFGACSSRLIRSCWAIGGRPYQHACSASAVDM
jgi:hypothetical protein